MTRRSLATVLALIASLLGDGSALGAQTIRGQVLDGATREPVFGVNLVLLNLDGNEVSSVTSDEEGRFELAAPSGGLYSVSADRIGYSSYRSDPVSVEDGGSIEVLLRLGIEAVPLAPFVVLADSQLRRGRAADFERRRVDPSISGHFLTAEDIRARPSATPSQLLRQLPTVDLYPVQTMNNPFGLDRSLIYLPGARGFAPRPGMCLAQVFVNGIPLRQRDDGSVTVDDMLDGASLLGVELYTRVSAAPLQYRGTGECGVVLYWTEEPEASSGNFSIKRIVVGVGVIVGVLVAGFVN